MESRNVMQYKQWNLKCIGSTSKKNNSKSKEGVYLLCESNKLYAGWCTVAHCERTEVK